MIRFFQISFYVFFPPALLKNKVQNSDPPKWGTYWTMNLVLNNWNSMLVWLWNDLKYIARTLLWPLALCCGVYIRPVVDPGQWGDPALIQLVVSQRNHIQDLALVENCLWDFLNQVVLQIQLLYTSKNRKKSVWHDQFWRGRCRWFGETSEEVTAFSSKILADIFVFSLVCLRL